MATVLTEQSNIRKVGTLKYNMNSTIHWLQLIQWFPGYYYK